MNLGQRFGESHYLGHLYTKFIGTIKKTVHSSNGTLLTLQSSKRSTLRRVQKRLKKHLHQNLPILVKI